MLNWLITTSLKHRFFVIAASLAFVVVGFLSLSRLDIDAFPDTTPVQVQINTVAPALSPEEVEQQITFPVEQAISGLPHLEQVRSISKFGLSQVVVVFADGTGIYFARQLIMERLSTVELPEGLPRPEMGPVSTGLGEVFHYVLTGKGKDLTELRTLHDWVVRPALRTVPGTAEVNSWGGYEKRYEVRIDPARLQKHGLTFHEVVEAVTRNNLNVGGGNIQTNGAMLLVHGIGRTTNTKEIANVVVAAHEGVPVRVGDVAEVAIGYEVRRGAVTAQGQGEAVLGLGFMLMGENSHDVTHKLKTKLEDIKKTLPTGVEVETVYDRTELVDHVIATVRTNLFEGGLLVIAVLFVFLGNLRAGLIVAAAIPFSMLFAFSGMLRFGIAGSLLSLGALDFGLVVDSSVIMIENVVRRIAHRSATERQTHPELVRDAAIEVRKPTMFGELIIMLVYLPILTLEGVEGKLFRPRALTVIFALVGSLVLSLTLMPVLASLLLPRRIREQDPWIVRIARAAYEPVLRFALRSRGLVLALAALTLGVTGMMARGLGSEFVPKLSEGAIVLNVVRLAGTDLSESVRYNTQMEQALLAAFPDEIRHVWSRMGTAEVATDPMGVELTDVFVSLTPRERWRKALTQDHLTELMLREIRDLPGQNVAFTQPIDMRLKEMISGVRSDVAVKLFGDDFDILVAKGREIEAALRSIQGCVDPSTEQITGQPVLQVRVKQDQVARYGIPAQEVLDLVESVGGKPLGEVVEGQLRFPLVVKLPERVTASPETIGAIELTTPRGERIPLSRLAAIDTVEGPATITREWGQRRIAVQCNVRGRDVGSFVAEAQRKVEDLKLPPGRYRVEWGGQFENLSRAQMRLLIVVPAALGLILALLYMSFGSLRLALLVFTGVPLAVTGGVAALWARGMPFSISAGVGFIALSGVAVLNGLVMVTFIRQLRVQGLPLDDAVLEGSLIRLRPVIMTALVAALGFVPMAMASGMGGEVQKPLATVVIGGILSSSILTLVVLPVLYRWFDPAIEPSASSPSKELS